MPLGEAIAEAFGWLFFEAFLKIIAPILRVPGVLVETALRKGRTFESVWEKGSKFWQALAGAAIYTVLVLLAIAVG